MLSKKYSYSRCFRVHYRVLLALCVNALFLPLAPAHAQKAVKRKTTTKRTSTHQSTTKLPRVILGDGVSSIGLPPGWRVISSQRHPATTTLGQSSEDMLIYGNTDQGMLINIITVPRNPREEEQMRNPQKYGRGGKPYRLGGIPGTLERKSGTLALMAIRNGKMYWFQMQEDSANLPGSGTLVHSFRPR